MPLDAGREGCELQQTMGGRKEGREGWFGWLCAVLVCYLGQGLAWGLCPGCDPHPTLSGWLWQESAAQGSSQVMPERLQCLGTQRGPGLQFLASLVTWPWSRGVEVGAMTASSSWNFYSATSEPLGPQGTLQAAQCCVLGHPGKQRGH